MVDYTDRGLYPMVHRFLRPKFLFGLEFREGILFGIVISRRLNVYKPYKAITTSSSGVATALTVAPLTVSVPVQFLDPRNTQNDILYLNKNLSPSGGYVWWLHAGFGIKQKYLYTYPRYPATKEFFGTWPNVTAPVPANGDFLGFVNAEYSPYSMPTDFSELAIVPGQHPDFTFYNQNPNGVTYQPEIHLLACTYYTVLFDPSNPNDQPMIRAIANGGLGEIFRIGGGDQPISYQGLAGDWEVQPILLDEAKVLGIQGQTQPPTTPSPQVIQPRRANAPLNRRRLP